MSTILVVAKAPVPGLAKTRLCPTLTPVEAATLAAASLLDTLDVVLAVRGARPVVALTGQLRDAVAGRQIAAVLRRTTVIGQRGATFADRLSNAHTDAAAPGHPVLQIGMDTPSITPPLLLQGLAALELTEAALGRSRDGGWWALGLRDPQPAGVLRSVPMSTPHTHADTGAALAAAGLAVTALPTLTDVDTVDDVVRVAPSVPHTRFGRLAPEVLRAGRGALQGFSAVAP